MTHIKIIQISFQIFVHFSIYVHFFKSSSVVDHFWINVHFEIMSIFNFWIYVNFSDFVKCLSIFELMSIIQFQDIFENCKYETFRAIFKHHDTAIYHIKRMITMVINNTAQQSFFHTFLSGHNFTLSLHHFRFKEIWV